MRVMVIGDGPDNPQAHGYTDVALPLRVFQGYRIQGNVCGQIFLRFIQGHQAIDRLG
uniref:Uncharacterized protein n=2 Tax=Oryza sativa subsp. japonica TaxID=39947 RepID=Q339S3_ORYSJ|nr:Hypothetical protein [Oryza sativa Japonica Group]ABB47204.1 hypothetical protein LOC_Os10g18920 [Oryza sativa Japonica Group]